MFDFEVNDSIIVEQKDVLEAALSTNPDTEKALQALIRHVLLEARKDVVESITFKHGDPRGAANAVRTAVYKRVFGGNVNIYNSRKAHGQTSYEPPRKGVSGRGGNRRKRSANTARIMGYNGLDRGFILRFNNEGANDRKISFKQNDRRHVDKWNHNPNTGYRGSIAAKGFFRTSGERVLNEAAEKLASLIENELLKILG